MASQTDPASQDCQRCRGTGWILVRHEGGLETAARCQCQESQRRQRLLEQAGIPDRYQHCALDSIEIWNPKDPTLVSVLRQVQDFIDGYPEAEKGLLLMGGVGTGKTHLAVAALRELIRRYGVRGCFADFTTLVYNIQMTFDGSGGGRQLVDPLLHAELLVLDELGAGRPSPWVTDLLYYLVNSRYLERRRTIFTTNYSDFPKRKDEESLTDRISARLRSRLYEMCTRLELRGEDYRLYQSESGRRARQ
jgi:DNA replication protein DnaC